MSNGSKVAIVTGSGRPWGLGRSVAVGLAKQGYDIAIVDVRDDWGQEAVETLSRETGQRVIYLHTDVSKTSEVQAMVRSVVSQLGGVDVLVNDAAIAHSEPAEELTDDAFERVLGVNLIGTALCCQAVIEPMRARGGGRIVNISSGGAVQPLRGLAIYAASKAGVIAFSKVLAREVARDKIVVTVVAPGNMHTGGMGSDNAPVEGAEQDQRMLRFGRPLVADDVADVVIYAATNAHHALAGQTLHANGGLYSV